MIHSLMVKDSIYEGRYILSIRQGKVYVKDTKNNSETELAVASIDHYLSSGTISSSGLLELKVNEIDETLKINVKSFTDGHYVSFDGHYGPSSSDVAQQSESGRYLTWSGSGWFLDSKQTIPNIPNNIQDLYNVNSGGLNITEGTLLIGSGELQFKFSNPRTASTSSSGYLRWSPELVEYILEDIIETITYSSGSGFLRVKKTDGNYTDIMINPISIYSSGLGNENASTGEFIVWSSDSGQWLPETRLHILSDSNKDSDSLVSASGIYNFTNRVISDLLTGGESSLNLSSINASGTISASGIIASGTISSSHITTNTLTAASGITLSSGTLLVQEHIEISSGNLNLQNGNIICSGAINTYTIQASGITSSTLTTTQISASGLTSSGIHCDYLMLTGSGKNLTYQQASYSLQIDFGNNSSYYYASLRLDDRLEAIYIENEVLGCQAIVSLYGSGTISNGLKYIDDSAIFYIAPFEEDIVLSDTVDALLTVHYSRDSGGKPVYYGVVSALNLVTS